MGSNRQENRSLLIALLLVILGVMILISMGRAVQFAFFSDIGGIDFHSYWYSGQFTRQGSDPFAAYLAREKPEMPLTFITGDSAVETDINRRLARVPANTAPIVLLLTPFSWLPWDMAKTIWFLSNLVLVILLPILVIRFLAPEPRMPWTAVLLTCFIFYALKGTRAALGTGQTSILVLALMVLAVALRQKSWLIAGLLLGIALSKYSIALPVFLFFLYKREFKILVMSLLVQAAGILLIGVIGGSSPLTIVENYYRIMLIHLDHPGIHLAELAPNNPALQILLALLLTVAVFGLLIRQFKQNRSIVNTTPDEKFLDLHLLSILSLWTLLVAYHRPYDAIIIIFFIVMMMAGFFPADRWRLSHYQKGGLILYFTGVMAILIMPYEQIGSFIPGNTIQIILDIIAKGVILALLSMLGVTFWLWARVSNKP